MYSLFAAGFLCALGIAGAAQAETPILTAYASESFVSQWGPGPQIEAGFEAVCGCDLQFVPGDILPRLLLEGARTRADVVIGLTTDVTARARASGLFAPHGQQTGDLTMPVAWDDPVFLPFNWAETAFVYDNTALADPPRSFEALLALPDSVRIVIQDPRTSVSGLALLLWVKAVFGDRAPEAWARLAPKILTVTRDWSESYGLFTSGEADMVMSFTTSPAYHIIAEGDRTKSAAIFEEGNYFMAELAGKIAGTDQPELADAFMAFVLSDTFQSMIATANWSYPARLAADRLSPEFAALPRPSKTLFFDETEAEALRAPALAEWIAAFSK